MTASLNSGTRRPLLVDEVDGVLEFVDSPAEDEPTTLCADSEGAGERPLLTDTVNRVVEFMDSAADETAPDAAVGLRPVFIDEVDRIVEYLDEADQEAPALTAAAFLGKIDQESVKPHID